MSHTCHEDDADSPTTDEDTDFEEAVGNQKRRQRTEGEETEEKSAGGV